MYGEYRWRDLPGDQPIKQERIVEEAVLAYVLGEYPIHRTITELVREMSAKDGEHDEREAVEDTVHRLTVVGLLYRRDRFVLPTCAALRFDELAD